VKNKIFFFNAVKFLKPMRQIKKAAKMAAIRYAKMKIG